MAEVASAYVTLLPSYRGGTRRISEQLNGPLSSSGKQGGREYGASFKKSAMKAFKGVGAALAKTLGGALAVGSIAVASSALGGMAVQGVALAGALSQAAGAAGLIPAALAGGAAIIGTFAIGLQGVGDAFKAIASGDAKKIDATVEKLSPNAQKFVKSLRGALPVLDGIKNRVQDRLFAGLGPVFAKALRDLGPIAQTGFAGIARSLNTGLRSTFAAVDNTRNLAGVQAIFANVAAALRNASGAAGPLVNSIIRFTSVASGSLPRVGAAFANLGTRAAAFIDRVSSDGSLSRWIDTGISLLSQLGSILRNVGSILGSVLGAGAAQGRGLLTSLQNITGTFAGFLKSAQGQAALAGFFHSAAAAAGLLGPVLGALAPLFVTVSKAIGPLAQNFAPILVDVLKALTPGISAVVAAVGPFVVALGPSLVKVAGALSTVLQALAPSLGPIAGLINSIIAALTPLTPLIVDAASALGPLADTLSKVVDFLAPVAPAAVIAFGAFAGVKGAVDAVSTLKEKVVDAISTAKEWRDNIVDTAGHVKAFAVGVKNGVSAVGTWVKYARDGQVAEIQRAKAIAASTVATVKNAVVTAASTVKLVAMKVAQVAVTAATKAWAAAQWLINAALEANPIVLIITALVALGVALAVAWQKSETFRDIVTGALNVVKSVALGVFDWLVKKPVEALGKLYNGITTAFGKVRDYFSTWGEKAKSALSAFLAIPQGISRAFGKIKGYMSDAFGAAKSVVSRTVGQIVDTVTGLPAAIGRLGSRMLRAGRDLMGKLFDGIKDALTGVGGFVKDLGKTIVNGIISAINHALHLPLKLPRIHISIPLAPDINIGGQTILPSIPHLATGGIVQAQPGGQLVLAGEAGQDEAVIPLDRLHDMVGRSSSEPATQRRDAPLIGEVTLNEVTDTVGTTNALVRRLAMLGA